jgi:hypothetical protein
MSGAITCAPSFYIGVVFQVGQQPGYARTAVRALPQICADLARTAATVALPIIACAALAPTTVIMRAMALVTMVVQGLTLATAHVAQIVTTAVVLRLSSLPRRLLTRQILRHRLLISQPPYHAHHPRHRLRARRLRHHLLLVSHPPHPCHLARQARQAPRLPLPPHPPNRRFTGQTIVRPGVWSRTLAARATGETGRPIVPLHMRQRSACLASTFMLLPMIQSRLRFRTSATSGNTARMALSIGASSTTQVLRR